MKKVRAKKPTKLQRYKKALEQIAEPIGMRESIRDYSAITNRLQALAREALAEKCPTCGKTK